MYERFTDRSRKVMQLANQAAQRRNQEYIGTEHLLLGIAEEGSGVAAHVLRNLGVDPQTIITEVEKLALTVDSAYLVKKLPATPRAKMVIEYAMLEARNLKHAYVGTEHILLGLLREGEAVASEVLINLGLRLDRVRDEIVAVLGSTDNMSAPFYSEFCARQQRVDSRTRVREVDEETKRRVRELADDIARLQMESENAIARQKLSQAARLRDRRAQCWKDLDSLSVPEYVLENVKRSGKASRLPLLEMLGDEPGEADASILSALPNPLVPPIKIVIGTVPRFPVSTLKAALAPDDICSPYFQAVVPLFSPESVSQRKGNHEEMTRCAFREIVRAQDSTRGRPVLLCVARPALLSQDVRREVFAGIQQANCEFVVFEAGGKAHALLGQLPSGTTLLEV